MFCKSSIIQHSLRFRLGVAKIVQFHIDSWIQMDQSNIRFFSTNSNGLFSGTFWGLSNARNFSGQILMVCSVEDFGGQPNEQFSPVEDQ